MSTCARVSSPWAADHRNPREILHAYICRCGERARERERENFLDSNIADGISQCCGLSSTGGDYYYYYYYSLLVLIAGSLFPEVRDLE